MKAIQYTAFGPSSVLQLSEVEKPAIKDDEILVRNKATTVNPFDIKVRSGSMQKTMPITLPWIPGSDVAGVVEAVGNKVTRFKHGDEIFATGSGGTYAAYVAVKEKLAALKPANLSMQEAAALAVPLNTAYTILSEAAQLQKGQKIFIQGAGGAVGGMVVQLAKLLGAYVIGTASGAGVAEIKALGADEAIDYKTQDFTQLVKDVDVVADLVGGETQVKSFAVLKKGGKLVSIVMPPSAELAEKYGVSAQFAFSHPSFEKLEAGKKLAEEGKIKPRISKTMKLEEAAAAQDLVSAGALNGKLVLEIE